MMLAQGIDAKGLKANAVQLCCGGCSNYYAGQQYGHTKLFEHGFLKAQIIFHLKKELMKGLVSMQLNKQLRQISFFPVICRFRALSKRHDHIGHPELIRLIGSHEIAD